MAVTDLKTETPHPSTPINLKRLSLRQNFSWTFLGNGIFAASQWGFVLLLAKVGSPEMIGQFALALAITAPVLMLTNLQLRTVQATDAQTEYQFGEYLSLRIVTTLLALVMIVSIVLVTGYRPETAAVIILVGIAKAFEAISDVIYGLFQQRERMDRIAKSMMIKGPLSLAALGAGVLLTGSVSGGAVGLALAWAALLIFYDIRNAVYILKIPQTAEQPLSADGSGYDAIQGYTPKIPQTAEQAPQTIHPIWSLPVLKKLTVLSLPLGFVMMLISLNVNIPRFFIERYHGEHDLGIFAAMASLTIAGSLVIMALGQSASPRLSQYYANANASAFRNLILKLLGVGLVIGGSVVIVSVIAGKQVLTLLYSSEYAEQVTLFTWLMFIAALNYLSSFMGFAITAARYFKIQMPLFLLVVIATTTASFILIPSQGLQGAVNALLTAAVIQLIGSSVVMLHALHKIKQPR